MCDMQQNKGDRYTLQVITPTSEQAMNRRKEEERRKAKSRPRGTP
ncbi:hypothetical protein MFRU_014g00500 [Monilinia fructicola]|nr:hypothetical protein MFRU_014g00500 [Monilinia fructicola]